MKYITTIITAALLLAAIGCMPPPPRIDELAGLDSGGAAPDSVQIDRQIRDYMQLQLIDPPSLLLKVDSVGPIWYMAKTEKYYAGWGVLFYFNARNRMGGYSGWEQQLAIFRDAKLQGIWTGVQAKMRKERMWEWREYFVAQ